MWRLVLAATFLLSSLIPVYADEFDDLMAIINQDSVVDLEVVRNMTCSDGSTIGRLLVDGDEVGRTLELPWRNNEQNISSIPAGNYRTTIRTDGRRGWRLQRIDVDDREYIQVHIGNYQSEIQGCILVGDGVASTVDRCQVTNSGKTLEKLRTALQKRSALLSANQSSPVSATITVRDVE